MINLDIPYWIKVLCYIEDKDINITRLHNELNISYAHTTKIVDSLFSGGYIYMMKKGRQRVVTLTDKGLSFINKDIRTVVLDYDVDKL